jgi:hypothetical protein
MKALLIIRPGIKTWINSINRTHEAIATCIIGQFSGVGNARTKRRNDNDDDSRTQGHHLLIL